jgi:DNA processing protein
LPEVESTAQLDRVELGLWLRLMHTSGVGTETALRLLRQFGLPADIFNADPQALAQCAGQRIARALASIPDAAASALIDRTLHWLDLPDNHLLTLADPRYPAALLHIPDPPILLYAKGDPAWLQRPCLAVVGSRNATSQGLLNAEHFSRALSLAGHTIVSGMALGIDTAAHLGGLSGTASTVAVIGTGIDIVYPARNRALAHQIAERGCLISEYALGTPAIASNFPRRNRIISGLSRAVLVIEAAAQSGSLITARVAAEQGRDVFAIPGSIHSPLAKGCHQLIKQGAKLIESAQDILEEFDAMTVAPPASAAIVPAPPENAELLAVLGFDPVDGDTLAARCGLDAGVLAGQLLSLEMQGLLEVLPGGSYRRVGRNAP